MPSLPPRTWHQVAHRRLTAGEAGDAQGGCQQQLEGRAINRLGSGLDQSVLDGLCHRAHQLGAEAELGGADVDRVGGCREGVVVNRFPDTLQQRLTGGAQLTADDDRGRVETVAELGEDVAEDATSPR